MARRFRALRILDVYQRSSTRPLLVETEGGRHVVKLVHAADGPLALAAEWLCSGFATALGLPVLELSIVETDRALASSIRDAELREAVERGAGTCLGFREIPGARPSSRSEIDAASDELALPLLWLDILVENPDRDRNNPNVLQSGSTLIPIDYAASLSFHHDWRLTEEAPGRDLDASPGHVFAARATALPSWHGKLRAKLGREVLDRICQSLPQEWLGPLRFESEGRQKLAYASYLWKRMRHLDGRYAEDPALGSRSSSG